jgi:hypothetical protein
LQTSSIGARLSKVAVIPEKVWACGKARTDERDAD